MTVQLDLTALDQRLADRTLDHSELADLLADISSTRTALDAAEQRAIRALRDLGRRHTADGDRLVDVHAAADKLGVCVGWLEKRTKSLPFVVRIGGAVRYSSRGIEEYIRRELRRAGRSPNAQK